MVFDVEGQVGRLSDHQPVSRIAFQIGDVEFGKLQIWGFHDEGHAVDERVVGIFHRQVELHFFLIQQFVAETHRKGIVLHLGLVGIHAIVGKGVLRDLHGRVLARECDVEVVHGGGTHVVQAEAQAAALVVVGSLVAIAFLVVDLDGIENEVGVFCRNGLDEMLITVVVLFGDGEFHGSAYLLRRDGDLLRVAGGDVETDDLSIGGQADGGAFVGFHCVLVAPSGENGQHGHFKLLWNFSVKVHVGIAMLMEQVVGDFLDIVVGPRRLSEEVFSSGVAEGRADEVGGMLSAVGRHEIGPHVVVGAPYVDVVDEGIGDLGGGNESQGAILVTVERFGETLSVDTTIVEPAR